MQINLILHTESNLLKTLDRFRKTEINLNIFIYIIIKVARLSVKSSMKTQSIKLNYKSHKRDFNKISFVAFVFIYIYIYICVCVFSCLSLNPLIFSTIVHTIFYPLFHLMRFFLLFFYSFVDYFLSFYIFYHTPNSPSLTFK